MEKYQRKQCFTVKGQPFFSIGVQLHNSSAYAFGAPDECEAYRSDREAAFAAARALKANTVAIPVCWDAFEPEEGVFDTESVRRLILRVREQGLHLVILWFATWKNGQMEYTPAWVKKDRERFFRVKCHDGSDTAVISPFCAAAKEADKRAFCRMMEIVKETDETENTVIAVQVENEAGGYGPTIRDHSAAGEAAYQGEVPPELIRAVRDSSRAENAGSRGMLYEAWQNAGAKESGSYKEVFGPMGAEACTAYGLARYIDEIAEAGRKVYDIFTYVNVWLDGNGRANWSIPGLEYPSGGAVSKMLPVWAAAAPHLDAVCPDNYDMNIDQIETTQDHYSAYDWPLYTPESGMNAVNATELFRSLEKGAIGCHVFGAESAFLDGKDPAKGLREGSACIQRSFAILRSTEPLILKYRDSGKMKAFYQHPGLESLRLDLGEYLVKVSFAGAGSAYAGWVPSDWRHPSGRPSGYIPTDIREETARGLLFDAGNGEFYLAGHGIRLFFVKKEEDGEIPVLMLNGQHQAHHTEYAVLEEGNFEDGRFVCDRRRSGDEGRHGVWAGSDCGVVHFQLV